MYIFHF